MRGFTPSGSEGDVWPSAYVDNLEQEMRALDTQEQMIIEEEMEGKTVTF